ncbi:uncharacterized protein LOC141817009 [Curcuma longa]|uniref:uncharacterized protein LOC141817009 n=1 Tax=Curcuma longa TaxID=136217 RepID=UPI003D9F11FE
MEHTELSLGPPQSMSLKELGLRKQQLTWSDPGSQSSNIDLQLNDPLPLDWEQCLDLQVINLWQSGKMYYLNRKMMKKTWERPKERSMELDLNVSAFPGSEGKANCTAPEMKQCSSSGNMVALVCVNCHLLVMLCKSSPLCPNCKYLHMLPPQDAPTYHNLDQTSKSLETLSLLH